MEPTETMLREFDQMEIVHRLAFLAAQCRHPVYLVAETPKMIRCTTCGSPHPRSAAPAQPQGARAAVSAVPVAPSAPSAEEAVRRVRDTVAPAGWSRIDPDLDTRGFTRDNKCGSCHQATGTGHKADCQNPMVLRERAVEWSIRDNQNGAHRPTDHGPEFWSSGCTAPACVAERAKLSSGVIPQAFARGYFDGSRYRGDIEQLIVALNERCAKFDEDAFHDGEWNDDAVKWAHDTLKLFYRILGLPHPR